MVKLNGVTNSAFVLLFCGFVGCVVCYVVPFWFINSGSHILKNFGLLTYCNDDGWGFMPGEWNESVIPGLIMFSIGLIVCLIDVMIASAYVCCCQNKGYRFCFACGALGLISALIFAGAILALGLLLGVGESKEIELDWAFVLAILSSLVILVASVMFFIAGWRGKSGRSVVL